MATGKKYAAEQSLGSVPVDLSAGSTALSAALYPSADFYITGFQAGFSYDLYVQENGVEAPTAANKRGFLQTFSAATGATGRLIVRGVPLVESQQFFIESSGTGPVTLIAHRYTWDDSAL